MTKGWSKYLQREDLSKESKIAVQKLFENKNLKISDIEALWDEYDIVFNNHNPDIGGIGQLTTKGKKEYFNGWLDELKDAISKVEKGYIPIK
jgi:hypothetical protein